MTKKPPEPLFCLKSDMGYIHNLNFSKLVKCPEDNEKTLLVATEQGFVYVWDLTVSKRVSKIIYHYKFAPKVRLDFQKNRVSYKQLLGQSIQAIHTYENHLITQEKSGLVKLWRQIESGFCFVGKFEFFGGYCRSLLHYRKLFLPQDKSAIDVIDAETMTLQKQLLPPNDKMGNVMAIKEIDESRVIAGYETGDVILWNHTNGDVISQLRLRQCITSLDYDPIRKRGVCGNSSEFIQIFSVTTQITLKCEVNCINEGCGCVRLRNDYKLLAVGGWNGQIRLLSWKSLKLLAVLDAHRDSITDLRFSEGLVALWGCPVLAASGADGVVSLWNLYN